MKAEENLKKAQQLIRRCFEDEITIVVENDLNEALSEIEKAISYLTP